EACHESSGHDANGQPYLRWFRYPPPSRASDGSCEGACDPEELPDLPTKHMGQAEHGDNEHDPGCDCGEKAARREVELPDVADTHTDAQYDCDRKGVSPLLHLPP